ncbi:MAG: sortase [Anaerolineales bacterium]|nr:sortase [Anaerolineales bacterium]
MADTASEQSGGSAKHSLIRRPAAAALTARLLIAGGAVLLILAALFGYPYVATRLTTAPTADPGVLDAAAAQEPASTVVSMPLPDDSAHLSADARTMDAPTQQPEQTQPAWMAASAPPPPTPTPAVPSRIVIPAIHLDAPVVSTSWQTREVSGGLHAFWDVPAERAAGWHVTSAPLGVPGNTVLNGHNTTHGEVFRDLYTLEPGASITMYSGDALYRYTVSEILILPEAGQPLEVRLQNARYILPTEDERLTLVTCHPYGSLRNRLIVIAKRVPATMLDPALVAPP